MKRKLVKQGAATLMISLPSKWLREHNLGKGDDIELSENSKELIISTKENLKSKKEITFIITEKNKIDLKNILTHSYRKGFDKINFKGIDSNLLKEIRKVTKDLLLGFEVTKRSGKNCLVENISEPIEQKYNIMMKKIFLIIKETQEIILEDFEGNKYDIKEIEETKHQQDKFILFCRRLLIKNQKDIFTEWELLTFLMHIQHTYYYFYKYFVENKIKPNKKIINLLRNLLNYFSLLEKAYYEKKIECIHEINNLKRTFHFGGILDLIEKSKGKEAVVFSYLREIFRLIQIGSSPILAEILDKT